MITLRYTLIATPVGSMLAVASPAGLCALEFDGREYLERSRESLARRYPSMDFRREPARDPRSTLGKTRAWLARYFEGRLDDGRELPLDLGGSSWEASVWAALLEIPAGSVDTYGALARRLGRPNAARAVGLAVGHNPVAIVVPCHRVVGSNGSLTGFGGGLPRKRWLLAHERAAVGGEVELALDL